MQNPQPSPASPAVAGTPQTHLTIQNPQPSPASPAIAGTPQIHLTMQNPQPSPASPAIAGTPQTHQACSACHHQRKKCSSNCLLAPYLPINRKRDFTTLQQVFGVSNVARLVTSAAAHGNPTADPNVAHQHSEAAVNSLVKEAELRLKDPVYGLFGQLMVTYQEKEQYRHQNGMLLQQIQMLQNQLRMCELQDREFGSVDDPKSIEGLQEEELAAPMQFGTNVWYPPEPKNYQQE